MLLARRLIAPKSGHTYPQVLGYYPKGEGGDDRKRRQAVAGFRWTELGNIQIRLYCKSRLQRFVGLPGQAAHPRTTHG